MVLYGMVCSTNTITCFSHAGESTVAVYQRQRESNQSAVRASAVFKTGNHEYWELSAKSDTTRDRQWRPVACHTGTVAKSDTRCTSTEESVTPSLLRTRWVTFKTACRNIDSILNLFAWIVENCKQPSMCFHYSISSCKDPTAKCSTTPMQYYL